ncbi:MAG: Mu transposase C-terminal domain-containing protein [Candidatus Eremiobacteraeota bacterium]|nr:Mu transposase C-terminal domain-containing protein [Candidatus Eremiobacteraeota bacterium]
MHNARRLKPGLQVASAGRQYIIRQAFSPQALWVEDVETGGFRRLFSSDLEPAAPTTTGKRVEDLASGDDKDWAIARRRLEMIRPLINRQTNAPRRSLQDYTTVAEQAGTHYTTIYRWVNCYESTSRLSSLLPEKRDGGRGRSRLSSDRETILNDIIQECYLNKQQPSVQAVHHEIARRCKLANCVPPHLNTVRNRIKLLPEKFKLERRANKSAAGQKYLPAPGTFDEAQWPRSLVQIDHMKLDIMVVDEVTRLPIDRPWITLAIDVFSRSVLGFYTSLEAPSANSTGLCIARAILPKDKWLEDLGVKNRWNCHGLMKSIHVDNGKDFRGKMLRRACEEYDIGINFRPLKEPRFGGHIERLLGTFAREIHNLSGTTFANPRQRAEYDSEGKAVWTLRKFEQWLAEYITGVYHNQYHSGIKSTPRALYNSGIFGNDQTPGPGEPDECLDPEQVRLDFMPYVERTVQRYGIQIDNIKYYHDVLRPYINAAVDGKGKKKQSYTFKRDPRDISRVYFRDPERRVYHAIPYQDTSHPAVSLWEIRSYKRTLEKEGRSNVNEHELFEARERLQALADAAARESKSVRRQRQRKLEYGRVVHPSLSTDDNQVDQSVLFDDGEDVEPFDVIEPA